MNGQLSVHLTFIGPCITIIFAEYNQQDATFLNLFIYVRRCTCFRQFFHPSSGAQNCTHSVRYLSGQYCYLLLAWPLLRSFSDITKYYLDSQLKGRGAGGTCDRNKREKVGDPENEETSWKF